MFKVEDKILFFFGKVRRKFGFVLVHDSLTLCTYRVTNTHPKRKDMVVLPNEVKRQFNHLYGAVRLGLCSSLAKCLTSFPSSDLF